MGLVNEGLLARGEQGVVEISGLTHAGEGVGRFRGVPVFIPGAIPGDRVEVALALVKKGFARGSLLAVLEPASSRRSPLCPRAGYCGGCAYQMMEYETQLAWKTTQVKDSLIRLGRLTGVPVRDTVGLAEPWHYRNKATFQVGWAQGRLALGFYQKGAGSLAGFTPEGAAPECLLLDRGINRLSAALTALLNEGIIAAEGLEPLKQVQLRRSNLTGEVTVTLITGPGRWLAEKALAGLLRQELPELTGLFRGVVSRQSGGGWSRKDKLLAGKPYLTDRLGALTYRLAPASFYQVNPGIARVMYDKTLEYAQLSGTETVVDAYSGIGAIALYLARQAGQVYGLEVNPTATADAKANASLNQIDNVEFRLGTVEVLLPALAAEGKRPAALILDPPRRGCAPAVLEAALAARPKRIIYLSCNPATLARDLRLLTEGGYNLQEAQPFDMFPWTAHVETACLLTR